MVIGLPVARATMTSGRLRPFCANFLTGDGRSILPHLHMPPSPAVSGGDLSCFKLASDPIETCVAGRLDVPNDRQDVGRKIAPLARYGHMEVLYGAGVPSHFPRALAGARAALVRSEIC
jgi:hypothetical protein